MRILITAGPTREFLDPVRYISNRSSGKMGCAVAESALRHGHEVIFVHGPLSVAVPAGVEALSVVSALDMLAAVEANLDRCDALVAAAAVADYRPAEYSPVKIKKCYGERPAIPGDESMARGLFAPVLSLVPNPDILATIAPRKGSRIFVGFAAETNDLVANASAKYSRKGLDLIVANDVTKLGSGFDTDTNEVVFITRDSTEPLPLLPKTAVADRIIEWIENKSADGGVHSALLSAQ